MATYYTLLTNYGTQQFAAAVANNRPLTVTHFAVGDGNGKTITPNATRTTLFKEVYRAAASRISLDPKNDKQIIFELTIPENVGGFTIREMGLFDGSGKMLAHANCPESYKPQLSEGTGKLQVLRMVLKISHKDAVTLTIDNSTIWATVGQATPKTITATSTNTIEADGHTHAISKASTTQAGIVQLNNTLTSTSTTQALTAAQGKALNDRITTVQTTANGKWTAVDATTARKGIVQLNNTLTSTSTTQALTAAQGKALNENKVGIANAELITGEKTFHHNVKIRSNGDNSKIGRWGQNAEDMFFQNGYSGKCLQIKNDGSLKYDNKLIFVKGFQNPSWGDVENKPSINLKTDQYLKTTAQNTDVYTGATFDRPQGWMRFEAMNDKRWKFVVQGDNAYFLPRNTSGRDKTIATVEDFSYQKIGNFTVRKYPDGTMIQTYFVAFSNSNHYRHNHLYSFNWANAFIERPQVFANVAINDQQYQFVDRWAAMVKSQSSGAKCAYYLFDPGGEQGNWEMQFLAIGRWK